MTVASTAHCITSILPPASRRCWCPARSWRSLAPPASSIKDERQKEAAQRYSIAAYHWSPDSKHLLFDSIGQLWLYSLDSGTAVQITSSADAAIDPKFSPDGERLAYVRKHDLVRAATSSADRKRRSPATATTTCSTAKSIGCTAKNSTSAAIISGRPTASRSPFCR